MTRAHNRAPRWPLGLPTRPRRLLVPVLLASLLAAARPASALDHVVYRDGETEKQVTGQVQVTAADGGLLLLGRDGVLHSIEPDKLVSRDTDNTPFEPLPKDQLAQELLASLPPGFTTYETNNYLIVHNTSRAYAAWCGSLFERLYRGFDNYWSRRGFKLHNPQFPLLALVFGDKESYVRYAQAELGQAAGSVIGYYSLRTNRMAMYDLTGAAAAARGNRLNSAQINAMLAQPTAAPTVATVIHEATHQIAFNSGMHQRYADIPLWLSEGVAMYFETPDLSSARGWSSIGEVNRMRMQTFRQNLPGRAHGSLAALLGDDQRFRKVDEATAAYADAWALCFFLNRVKQREFVEYLKLLAEKDPLIWDKPEERLAEFTKIFGDLDTLEGEFIRYMSRVK